MYRLAATLACLVLAIGGPTRAAERVLARTASGSPVSLVVDLPKGVGPFPVAVIAAGRSGGMHQPLLDGLARALVDEGVAAVRFDWSYWAADPIAGKPSSDLGAEIQDMAAVISWTKADKRLDSAHMVLVGKSLGSLVAYRRFTADPAPEGLVLLTPICMIAAAGAPTWLQEPYPSLATERRPLTMVLGDRDPSCPLPRIYSLAAGVAAPLRIAVVGGDHGFVSKADRAEEGEELTRRNIDLAVRNATDAVLRAIRPVR